MASAACLLLLTFQSASLYSPHFSLLFFMLMGWPNPGMQDQHACSSCKSWLRLRPTQLALWQVRPHVCKAAVCHGFNSHQRLVYQPACCQPASAAKHQHPYRDSMHSISAFWIAGLCLCASAGAMTKTAKNGRSDVPEPTRLTTSPSMEHFMVRSGSLESVASLDGIHDADNLSLPPRHPLTLPR